MEAFVYSWSDHKTAKIYVGVHKGSPDDGYICSSKPMKSEYIQRPEDFTRQIIATGTLNGCAVLEVAIIKQLLKNKGTCYNRAAGKMILNEGVPKTKEHNKKVSESLKGRKLSEKHILNMKKALTGRKLSANHIKNMSISREGSVWGADVKSKISKSLTGKKLTDSHKQSLKEGWVKRKAKLEEIKNASIS